MSENNDIKLLTWNVTGIMSSASYLSDLLSDGNIDICGISEHWLTTSNLFFLGSISNDYDYFGTCDKTINLYGRQRVNKGGVALLWRKYLSDYIVPLDIDDDRIIGIQLQLSKSEYMFIFQVYLPCVNYNCDAYTECIAKLYELYCTYSDKGTPIFMGDFNASVYSCSLKRRDVELYRFFNDCNLSAANLLESSFGSVYTYVSYDDEYCSTIDYISMPVEMCDLIVHCEVADDKCLNVSRHKPIFCCINTPVCLTNNNIASKVCINWKQLSTQSIDMYLLALSNDSRLSCCLDTDLNETCVDSLYSDICKALVDTAKDVFPLRKSSKKNCKPYWCDELDSLHAAAERSRAAWCRDGRPRGCWADTYRQYKANKRVF